MARTEPLGRRAATAPTRLWVRAPLGFAITALAFALFLLTLGWLSRPDLSAPVPRPSEAEVAAAKRDRSVSFDPSAVSTLPRIQQPVDASVGHAARWWPNGESPVLSELVAAGKLPKVIDRVGAQPLVLDGGSPGKYGGTWLRAATSGWDVFIVEYRFGDSGLFRWSPLGYPIVPHLGTRIDASDDLRSFVIHLRPGVHWSDGHPFGADDILFWWKYEEMDTTVGDGVPRPWLVAGTGKTNVEKVDDLTVRVSFDEPFGTFTEVMAAYSHWMTKYPAHYLRKYHPDLADPEFLAGELKAFGLSSPFSLWEKVTRFDNPEHPRLWPWIPRTFATKPPYVFVRNPYYFAVDPQGSQLPYIDRLQFDVKTAQMLPLSFASGDVSMQGRHVSYDNYTDLMSRKAAAGFSVKHWYPASRSTWLINPNLTRYVDPERPATADKARLLADARFRQALSLAIDRPSIIKAHYDGQVRASQVEPGAESPFHDEKLGQAFIEYDPERASALLDELGLVDRDVDGMRTFEDGRTMTFFLDFSAFPGMGPAQFVVDDWRRVGLRVSARELSRRLFQNKRDSSDFDMVVWASESDFFPLLEPRSFVPPDPEALYATIWGRWFTRGGFYGSTSADDVKNAYGPPRDHPMMSSYEALVGARKLGALADRVARFQTALDNAAENLWTINIVEAPPFLVVVDNDLRNVPDSAMYGGVTHSPGNAGIETYYFDHPSRAADAEVRAALETPGRMTRDGKVDRPVEASSPAGSGLSLASLVRWALLGIVLCFVALTSVRHPFVLRRLLILVPTLLVISVAVFAVIQLPPGDFLTSRLLLLSESGDSNNLAQIEELRRIFHFDEPVWQRYLRWMGVPWFSSFNSADLGLLQGYLGRSMENNRAVNEIVGDRILLTVAISLGTIVLTWAIAIPIGIYSAVKQYSFGDYAFTLVAFVGMSVPPFLLALVLMVVAGVSGLFSAEYVTQPDWTWGKVMDLLRHIWVPIVVMGVSGTAGLTRIMRANLLDELRKPYVTTARARGVRPLKLLLKYPVRVALNPFVSGIGHLFPQLVSGGAIVAIVLSLPTVGPLQIEALFSEDAYLAGSMLMVLSMLAVFGTLVADLLLLWLDPRIRYDARKA